MVSGADPGFPVGEGANPPGGGGAPTYDFAKLCETLHEIEKSLGHGGGGAPGEGGGFPKSATGYIGISFFSYLMLTFVNILPDINECLTSPCSNGGTCVDQYLGYNCNCTDQWLGQNCTGISVFG